MVKRPSTGRTFSTYGWLLALVIALGLSGCTTPQNRAQGGALLGALGGGLAGSLLGNSKNKEQNALIGAAIGGLLGYTIGNEMDKQDRAKLNQVFEKKPSHQTTSWQNPDTGRSFAVTPKPATHTAQGELCREAEIKVWIDGRPETAVRKACRRDDGRWDLI
uniref:Putative 17 kDa surface antigen [omp] n=1 Tax=Magnetococcus massalia (strain MO-1) TaxID=451514 RepID=A0A1S7LN76_MAGMO|nr:Putative 17 kDa surface antigen [omp] [Candidatus Magnetococcus massalia]